MPMVEISLTEGRSDETLAQAAAAVTHALATALDAPPGSIRVLIRQLPEEMWFVGGEDLKSVRAARAAAAKDPQ